MRPEVQLRKVSGSEKLSPGQQETRYSSGCRCSGCKLGHAHGDQEDSDIRDRPTPDHCDWATVWKGIDENGGDGGQKTNDTEGNPEDLERGELSLELLLVAQGGEESFIRLTVLVLHGSGRERRSILRSVSYT